MIQVCYRLMISVDTSLMAKRTAAQVSKRLKQAMASLGTTTEAGAKIGVGESTIRKWIAQGNLNKVPGELVVRVVAATGIAAEEFIVSNGE